MKQKYLFSALFVFLLFTTSLLSHSMIGKAEENGGAVQTNGGITFYEETTSSSPKQSSDDPIPSSTPKPVKPVGRYPSTGELVKTSLGISGIVLVGVCLILFYLKRKKRPGDTEGKGS